MITITYPDAVNTEKGKWSAALTTRESALTIELSSMNLTQEEKNRLFFIDEARNEILHVIKKLMETSIPETIVVS